MLTPAEADAAIAAALPAAGIERVPLAACAGRILRENIAAERDAPPFDRVTMDGIAIAAGNSRREFRVAGLQPAGQPPLTLPSHGDCIEVMTGAVLPTGCDTVVPVERLQFANGRATLQEGFVPERGQFVHRRAADAKSGDRLLAPGTRLNAPEIAIAASASVTSLEVSRRPRIAVITTGDELIEPGQPIAAHQLRRSNAYGLATALRLAGFEPLTDLHLPDDLACSKSRSGARSMSTMSWCSPAACRRGDSITFPPRSPRSACAGFFTAWHSAPAGRCGSGRQRLDGHCRAGQRYA